MSRRPVYVPRQPVRTFLRVHGPSLGAGAMGALAFAVVAADYALQPHGFTRFVVAVVCALS